MPRKATVASNVLQAPKVTLFNGQQGIRGRYVAASVRDQRDSGGRRIRRRTAAGDRGALGRYPADRASGRLRRPHVRTTHAGAVLQPDWRCRYVHLRGFADDVVLEQHDRRK